MFTVLTSWPSSLLAGEGRGRRAPGAAGYSAPQGSPRTHPAQRSQHNEYGGQKGSAVVALAQIRVWSGSGGSDGTRLASDYVQRSPKAENPRPDFGSTARLLAATGARQGPARLRPLSVQPAPSSRLYLSFFFFVLVRVLLEVFEVLSSRNRPFQGGAELKVASHPERPARATGTRPCLSAAWTSPLFVWRSD